jgi:hypothetical protein
VAATAQDAPVGVDERTTATSQPSVRLRVAIPLILLIPPRNPAPRCEIQSSMHSIALMLIHPH